MCPRPASPRPLSVILPFYRVPGLTFHLTGARCAKARSEGAPNPKGTTIGTRRVASGLTDSPTMFRATPRLALLAGALVLVLALVAPGAAAVESGHSMGRQGQTEGVSPVNPAPTPT